MRGDGQALLLKGEKVAELVLNVQGSQPLN
jgi:hypothetical protein